MQLCCYYEAITVSSVKEVSQYDTMTRVSTLTRVITIASIPLLK